MEKPEKWSDHDAWETLLAAVCDARGLGNTTDLAHRLCAASGRHTKEALESTIRSINNWKNGKNLPRQQNLKLLAEILQINEDPVLRQAWTTLLESKPVPVVEGAEPTGRIPTPPTRHRSWFRRPIVKTTARLAATLSLIVLVAAGSFYAGTQWSVESKSEGPTGIVYYRSDLQLKVGQVVVLHGYRGNCGGPAPSAEATEKRLPRSLKTGMLAAGKIGVRYSRHCQELTPVRAVRFLAQRPGIEQFKVFGDDVRVEVQ